MRSLFICSLLAFGVSTALPQSANVVLSVTTLVGQPGIRGYVNGTGASAQLYGPSGIVVDASGNLYVADSYNNMIRKVTPAGVVTILAGTPFDPLTNQIINGRTDGTGTNAKFYFASNPSSDGTPFGPPAPLSSPQPGSITMASDTSGNIYVADTVNCTIRKVTSAGVVTTLAGSGSGYADGSVGGALFYAPIAIAVDGSGNVFVSDAGTIRKITPAGVVSTFAGASLKSGSNDNNIGTSARFNNASGLVADSAGYVYVADTANHTIRKITPTGVVTTLAGMAGKSGSSDGIGAGARFNLPSALTIDSSGNLYVADTGNNTIRRVSPGGVVSTLAGLTGTTGSANGTGNATLFNAPYGIAVDSAGNVYVSDTGNNTIRKGVPTSTASGANLQIQTQPLNQGIRSGQSVTFSVSATGTPAPSYQWMKNGVNIAGATSSSYTMASATTSDVGYYSVALTSGVVTVTSKSAEFRAIIGVDYPTLLVDDPPASLTVDAGQSARLSVVAFSTLTPTYQWLKNGVAIAGATSDTYIIAATQTSDAGNYSVVVTNSSTTVTSNNTTLTVNPGSGVTLTAPAITSQPASLTVTVGATASFSVTATGNPAPTYQWKKNGVAIAGATAATLTLANAQTSDAASYTVTATNSVNAVTSNAAVLTVNPVVTPTTSRLASLSVRIGAGTGDQTLIVGFIVSGNGKSLLIRGVGPTLGAAPYNVPGVLADPQLSLYNGSTLINSNDNWSDNANASQIAATATQLQDFALPAGSKDAALLTTLNDGLYTAQVSGVGNTTGITLVEVYDANATAAARLTGVSARTQVGTGANVLIAGFSISGTAPMKVLLRGVGPTLASFAVTGVLADPQIAVFTSPGGTQISSNDNWSDNANAAQIAANSGFPLPAGSKDAALLLTLNPGTYTVQVSGVGNTTGVALVEVYEVDN